MAASSLSLCTVWLFVFLLSGGSGYAHVCVFKATFGKHYSYVVIMVIKYFPFTAVICLITHCFRLYIILNLESLDPLS